MRPLLRLAPYLRRYWKLLAAGYAAVLLSDGLAIAVPLVLRQVFNAIDADIRSAPLLGYGALVVGLTFLSGIFLFLTRQTIIVTSRKIEYDLRNDFLAHLERLSLSYFHATPTGDLMAHATNDISAVRNVVGPGIMYSLDTGTSFFVIIAIMLSIDPGLTAISLVPLPLISLGVYFLGQRVHKTFEEVQAQYSTLTARAQESISGIRVIKGFVREHFEIGEFGKLSREYLDKNMRLAVVQSLMWPLMFLLTGISLLLVLWYGGIDVIRGTANLGTIVAFMLYLGMLIWPMIAIGWVTSIFQRGAASMGRLGKIFDTPPTIADGPATDAAINAAQLKPSVEFKNVSFSYASSPSPVISDVSFEIPAGWTVAVVGYTGTGKTTLLNLIPRLHDPSEGTVRISGVDVRSIPLEVLRTVVGYVPQEAFLFSATIRENIAFGSPFPITDERIAAAARIASFDGEIRAFLMGFDTVIGERGVTLSGGQKQRLTIARALVRDPKILILDDALSAVDTATEENILSRLQQERKGRTNIIVSHRISTVKDANLIIVLADGLVAERGTHEELLALGGIYADLHEKQLLEEELESL